MTDVPNGPVTLETVTRDDEKDELSRLFSAAAGGDEKAFESILTSFEKGIYNACFQLLKNAQDAEDATQDTFIKLWRTLPSFRGECAPSTWIWRIARNVCLDRIRRRHGVVPVSMDTENEEEEDTPTGLDLPDPDPIPPEQIAAEETLREAQEALSSLPSSMREILTMREINGMDYETIAAVLGISVGTVKSRLARSRESLRKAYFLRNKT